jgi:hypothetical protein
VEFCIVNINSQVEKKNMKYFFRENTCIFCHQFCNGMCAFTTKSKEAHFLECCLIDIIKVCLHTKKKKGEENRKVIFHTCCECVKDKSKRKSRYSLSVVHLPTCTAAEAKGKRHLKAILNY